MMMMMMLMLMIMMITLMKKKKMMMMRRPSSLRVRAEPKHLPYIYIYTYMCIYVCVYIYVCVCIYVYIYIHTYKSQWKWRPIKSPMKSKSRSIQQPPHWIQVLPRSLTWHCPCRPDLREKRGCKSQPRAPGAMRCHENYQKLRIETFVSYIFLHIPIQILSF